MLAAGLGISKRNWGTVSTPPPCWFEWWLHELALYASASACRPEAVRGSARLAENTVGLHGGNLRRKQMATFVLQLSCLLTVV